MVKVYAFFTVIAILGLIAAIFVAQGCISDEEAEDE
jgi:hypothetical protein